MVKKQSYAIAANKDDDDDELHHDNDNEDEFLRCSGCPKTFSTIKGLKNHLSQSSSYANQIAIFLLMMMYIVKLNQQ